MSMAVTKIDPWKEEDEDDHDDAENEGKRNRIVAAAADVDFDPTALMQKIVDHDSTNPDDFLGAYKSKKKKLFYGDGRVIGIHEALRGKIICLYFSVYSESQGCEVPNFVTHFYRSLKLKRDALFEMVYVPRHPFSSPPPQRYDESKYLSMLRSVPFPAVHIDDSDDWGEHLFNFARPSYSISFIDATHYPPGVEPLPQQFNDHRVCVYGPHLYPFTLDRLRVVEEKFSQLGAKKSITDILDGSGSYLVDCRGIRIPVSHLENKHVALYAYHYNGCDDLHGEFMKKLEDIYRNTSRDDFEIVFINMQHKGGYEDQTSFYNAISSMPWLALPFDDDRIWNLERMVFRLGYRSNVHGIWGDFPIMYIKPAGNQSPIDPYGYLVLQEFGPESYPFTRERAANMAMEKLKTLTWESFAREAQKVSLDFNSLLSSNEDADVPLFDIFPNQGRNMLLLFAKRGTLSQGRFKSLLDAYSEASKSPTPFEVIFVSLDDTTPDPFIGGREIMPWHDVKTPLLWRERSSLLRATLGYDIYENTSHFIAFGSDGNLLRAGIPTWFNNREFPFLGEDEYKEHVYYCLMHNYKWACEPGYIDSFEQDGLLWDTSVDLVEE